MSLLKRAENSGIKAIINQSISSSCSSSSGSSSSSSSSVCVCVLSDLTQVRLYCPDWELTTLSTRSSLTPASLSGDTGYRTVSIPSIGVPVQSAEGSVVSHIVFHVQFPCSISTGVCQHISCSTCSFPVQSARELSAHIVFHVQFPCSVSTSVCQHISCSTCSFPVQSAPFPFPVPVSLFNQHKDQLSRALRAISLFSQHKDQLSRVLRAISLFSQHKDQLSSVPHAIFLFSQHEGQLSVVSYIVFHAQCPCSISRRISFQ